LAQSLPKPVANSFTLPLVQTHSTRFEQNVESTENHISNADIKTTSAKDLIIELFNKIAQEFLLNNLNSGLNFFKNHKNSVFASAESARQSIKSLFF
jgi:hypothetical protein